MNYHIYLCTVYYRIMYGNQLCFLMGTWVHKCFVKGHKTFFGNNIYFNALLHCYFYFVYHARQGRHSSTVWLKKVSCILWWIFQRNRTIFENSFTVTLSRKSAVKTLLHTSPHLQSVTTLPCKILILKNCVDRKHSKADRRARAEENVSILCDHSKWAGTKPIWPTTNSSFNTLNSTTCLGVVQIIFFTVILVWSI